MKKPEYPSSNGSHSSHPKLRLPFQWSTRRRLVTTIVIVFFMLTGVVTAMTYYVVNRQLETVTVNKSFTQAEDADEQHSLNSQAIPPDSGKDYVSAGYDSGKDALTLTMEQGDIKSRDLILAVSIAPIIVFGILSGGITWIIATRTQRRINSVASQIIASDAGLERQPIVIPYENDEAYTIASAYNLMLKDLNSAISREKEFIADASHELKNPLAATSAALEIPLHNQLFDERCRPFVEKALASNHAGVEIVNHLLELSKVQQLNRADLSRVNVAEIIRNVLQENMELIGDRVDNKHLNENGIRYFCALSKEFVLITTNTRHPAFNVEDENLHIIYQNELSLKDALIKLKSEYGCERITIQTGGTLNNLFLREKLFDYVDIIIAPVLIGGKDTSTLIDGKSLTEECELSKLGVVKLQECVVLENSYLRLRYEVIH